MSNAGNTGYATMQVIPSFRGVTAMMNRELAGIMPQVGGQAGAQLGAGLSAGLKRGLAVGGGMAVLATAFLKTLNVAREFEAQISAVGAVSGATGGALDSLRTKALQLGADTAFGASEAASAMEELVKAGVSVDGVLGGAADATVALAAASGVSLTTAAEVAANAMNAFGLSAAEMPRIADLVAGAANTSAIGVEDFAYSLQMSGAVANLVGLDFEDLAVGIAAMGNAGIKGSDAGTSLKTMLMRLEPQTDRAKTAMDELGITTGGLNNQFFDARGEAKSLAEISGVLTEALEGQTNQQKLATLNTLFGADAIRAAAVLADQGAVGIAKMNAEMEKVSAAEVARQRLDNLNGSLEQLSGSVETLAIMAGTVAIPAIRGIADGLTDVANFAANPPDGFFDPLLSAGRDLLGAGEHLVDIFGDLVAAGRPLAEFGAKLGAAGVAAGLTVMADALERTTGLLAEHSEVLAVAAGAWLGLKAAAGISALFSAATTALLTIGAHLEVAALRATAVGTAMFTMGTNAQLGARMLGVAVVQGTTGLGLLSMAAMGVVAGALLIGSAFSKAASDAKRDLDALKPEGFDDKSIGGLVAYNNELVGHHAKVVEAGKAHQGWQSDIKGGIEVMTPFGNSVVNAHQAVNETSDALRDNQRALASATGYWLGVTDAVNDSARQLDYYRAVLLGGDLSKYYAEADAMDRWARALDLPPEVLNDQQAVSAAIRDGMNAARNGTPLTDSLAESYATLAEETATATEKLDAWKDAVDRALGVKKDIVTSTAGFEESLDSLQTQLSGSWIKTLDATSEEGRKNIDVLAGAIDAAKARVGAYGDAYGIDAAAMVLESSRQQIIETGKAAGLTGDEISALLDQMGMTPDTLQLLIDSTSIEGATGLVEGLNGQLDDAERRRTAQIDVKANLTGAVGDILGKFLPGFEFAKGAITSYATGGINAHVQRGERIRYAEPSTGGEAYIPRLGNRARSTAILQQASSWYGYQLVPKRATPMALGGIAGPAPATATGAEVGGVQFTGDIVLPKGSTGPRQALDLIRGVRTAMWLEPSAVPV
jgi:TP901 family phage tail tape measure protein